MLEHLRVGLTILSLWWRDFRAVYSTRVLLLSTAPRFVLQVLFYALLGRVVAGEAGLKFAFVGAVCCIVTLATVVGTTNVLEEDKLHGTIARLRLGSPSTAVVAAWRAPLYAVEGFVGAVLALVISGLVLGLGDLVVRIVPLLPVVALAAASSTAIGLVTAALAVGGRGVALSNLLVYLVFLLSGAIVAQDALPVIGGVGDWLPVTHALASVRLSLAGQPFLAELFLEILVGSAWFAVAVLLMGLVDRRSRSEPRDQYI